MIIIKTKETKQKQLTIMWNHIKEADEYQVFWANKNTKNMAYKLVGICDKDKQAFTLKKSTHVPHYFKIIALKNKKVLEESEVYKTAIGWEKKEQLEDLSRGSIGAETKEGIFLGWRLFKAEVTGYSDTGLTGTDFAIYRNGKKIAVVTDSTNYLDKEGCLEDVYQLAAIVNSEEQRLSKPVPMWESGSNYIDLPLKIPAGGVTKGGNYYNYEANDMSVGDVDGEYEFFVKWDPTNSHDNSHSGYTGNCLIDCYKLDGQLLWRLDMGVNIRAGAHYTQLMVFDFNGDGKAEFSVKTAPGTNITKYNKDGSILSESYISMPKEDMEDGYSHKDDYVCSRDDYKEHVINMFMDWHLQEEVITGKWPKTLEECFSIEPRYSYPLSKNDAEALSDYMIYHYAKQKSPKVHLEVFDGFIYEGPEYLTMFSGEGDEIETITYPFPRIDDGLRWGDYAMEQIEPCNRSERFLSGVAYLDGERPYLIICRGYYSRTTIAAYQFFDNTFQEYFKIDSGFVPMDNPFNSNPHMKEGSDPIYGILAGQGNHALATADVDGDGCQEIIFGGAVIDHDGSLLYSCYGNLPDGTYRKFGHGDALHVADIDPDKPGLEIFSVFEEGMEAPYGYALRDAETGEVIFGEYAEGDLGRCMIGDINPNVRGLETWVLDVRSCKGEVLTDRLLGTNQNIKWAADLTTQIIDGPQMKYQYSGIINDNIHGLMLVPVGTLTNNGTKGNPCLIADVFGDFREELLLRYVDSSAIRIYTNTEITNHKLFTFMQDIQYRTGAAWQNNCYNQPCYPEFYYAGDMDFEYVYPK